MLNSFMGDCEW